MTTTEYAPTVSGIYTPTITAEQIVAQYHMRQNDLGPYHQMMRNVATVIEGDMQLPMPEIMAEEDQAMVPNLAAQGMDQISRRVASMIPNVDFRPLYESDRSVELAADRTRVMKSWHRENQIKKKLGRRGRWFLAWGSAPAIVRPKSSCKLPIWQPTNPLNVYPSNTDYDDFLPENVITERTCTYFWLRMNYPTAAEMVHKNDKYRNNEDGFPDDMKFTLLEYISGTEVALAVVGHGDDPRDTYSRLPGDEAALLECDENRIGRCWAVVPGRITLDKPQGHFDQIIGMYKVHAMLMSMQVIQTQRSIWPREWLVAQPGQTARVIKVPNPKRGEPGEISGGTIERQQNDPHGQALETMDRIEYAERMVASIPAEFGGMSPTNVRTARRGGQVIGNTIDFTIMEAQDIFAEALYEENKIAIAIDKAYFPTTKTYVMETKGGKGKITYRAKELWETDKHICEYPISGTDAESFVLTGGQRMSMGSMSQLTFMEKDPLIDDPKLEQNRIDGEGIRRAGLASLQTQAAAPEGPYSPQYFKRLGQLMRDTDNDIWDAMEVVEAEIKAEQAKQQEAMQPAPGMGGPADPNAMPGSALPGEPGAAPPAIPEPAPSSANLAQILSNLGTQQQATKYRGGQ